MKETPKKSFQRNLGHVRCTNMFSKAGQEKQLKEKVLKTTGLRVENNDDASLLVCRKCERSVNNITVFQEKVTQSQRVFAQTFFFKRVIEMSPSQETLSVRKKHMADTEAMSDFDFDKVWKELVEYHPFFLDVLNAIAGETCDLADTPPNLQVKHCFIYSILMMQRWHELSLLQRINTVLISGGGSKQVYIVHIKIITLSVLWVDHSTYIVV